MLSKGNIPEGFKETDIGTIPGDWEVARLKDVATFTRKPRELKLSEHDTIPFIPMELVPDNSGCIVQYELRPGRNIRSGTYCEKGDILLAKITPSFENGKQGIVGEIPLGFAYATTEVYSIRAKPDRLDQMFLFHFLRLPGVRADIAGKMEGSTGRQRVPKAVIENYLVPLPPLAEQRAIAYVLRTVQRAKEATEGVIAALREMKKSLMKHLFTYGPVPVDKADQIPMQETEIGPLPSHWQVVKLGEMVTLRKGTIDPSDVPEARYVGLEHIVSGEVRIHRFGKASDTRSAKSVFEKEDILYGKLRPYLDKAIIAEWDGVCSTDILVLKPKAKQGAHFVVFLMHSPFVLYHAIATMTGVNHPRTSWRALSQAKVPLPPLPEQQEIARILQTVDRKIEAEERRKAALEALFKTLLHDLMTARRRVPADFVARFANQPEDAR